MADSRVSARRRTAGGTTLLSWVVVLAVVVSLAVIPGVILVSIYLGSFSSLALFRGLTLAAVVMVPGIVLGAMAVLVMLGSD